jgi:hypothetical protein
MSLNSIVTAFAGKFATRQETAYWRSWWDKRPRNSGVSAAGSDEPAPFIASSPPAGIVIQPTQVMNRLTARPPRPAPSTRGLG